MPRSTKPVKGIAHKPVAQSCEQRYRNQNLPINIEATAKQSNMLWVAKRPAADSRGGSAAKTGLTNGAAMLATLKS
jgi:hypothetical protein